ncbi:acetyltransferase [Colletotrichum graminicola M1.001]|uniref:Acetyltransferase n=1 Tax=Colletotrichum graminicola (strain M1.001 / M2 / FGSC 10212) TaxID=645133 RepID=E3QXA1_COLGM|nr:acetyltransferase [Colletotrichum graminicola M1.001]EFQ35489.1 acetyltransferase [Colletotrichum graminicola M1.001]
MPNQISKQWYRDDYFISTDRSLLDLGAINDAFDSELMWWTRRVPEAALRRLVDNSLCLGVYKLPAATADIAGKTGPALVGLARVVTDYVTIGYLADVYVLPSHQGKGLAPWLMVCLHEVLYEWPHLRRFLLLTSSPQASQLYEQALGVSEWGRSNSGELFLLEKRGPLMPAGPPDTDDDE